MHFIRGAGLVGLKGMNYRTIIHTFMPIRSSVCWYMARGLLSIAPLTVSVRMTSATPADFFRNRAPSVDPHA
jgi:hypothetical protein